VPSIGSVLIFGDRGAGKSTVVRALAQLLPKQKIVRGCPYRCDLDAVKKECEFCGASKEEATAKTARETRPAVDFPLGSTEDRIIGTLVLEKALTQGIKTFFSSAFWRRPTGAICISTRSICSKTI